MNAHHHIECVEACVPLRDPVLQSLLAAYSRLDALPSGALWQATVTLILREIHAQRCACALAPELADVYGYLEAMTHAKAAMEAHE